MYVPDGVELTKEEKMEMAKQKQEIDHSNTRLRHNPFDDQKNKNTIHDLAKNQVRQYFNCIATRFIYLYFLVRVKI